MGRPVDLSFLFIALVFACNSPLTLGISCKDENNNDVDWFINYKFPKIDSEPEESDLYKGRAYAYLTPERNASWYLSDISVGSPKSMLGRTWQEFANNQDDSSHLFYNDDAPGDHSSVAIGHLKGYFAFDSKTGFWLRHSVPNFGEKDRHEYPDNALVYGQMAICVTLNISYLNEICNHLLYCNPNIYERKLSKNGSNFLDRKAKSLFTKKPSFIRKEPFLRESTLRSLDEQLFYIFAKDNQLHKDIYSDIIAESMKTDLLAETWKRGSGVNLSPVCRRKYSVVDITAIKMKPANRKESISFKSSSDHSKWAISANRTNGLVCIGDLNRMKSQKRRGGGVICFKSKHVWAAFNSIIYETEECAINED